MQSAGMGFINQVDQVRNSIDHNPMNVSRGQMIEYIFLVLWSKKDLVHFG